MCWASTKMVCGYTALLHSHRGPPGACTRSLGVGTMTLSDPFQRDLRCMCLAIRIAYTALHRVFDTATSRLCIECKEVNSLASKYTALAWGTLAVVRAFLSYRFFHCPSFFSAHIIFLPHYFFTVVINLSNFCLYTVSLHSTNQRTRKSAKSTFLEQRRTGLSLAMLAASSSSGTSKQEKSRCALASPAPKTPTFRGRK